MERAIEMENNGEVVVVRTMVKDSSIILVSGGSASVKTVFTPPLYLKNGRDYELAKVNLETYYSFANIQADNNSLKWSGERGTTWTLLHIPTGCYELMAINAEGDKGDPAVDIDIVAELCKHLPMEMVEQYRRGACPRYAINSMEDIELHDAAHVKAIIDKGGRCNATQSDVARMASLSQTQVNSNYVLNFHNDAYNMDADMVDFHYFCVFLVYKIKAYATIKH